MLTREGRISPVSRRALLILPFWLGSVIWVWWWWISQAHMSYLLIYIPLTIALIYETTIMPGFVLLLTIGARIPKKRRPMKNQKVAVITLCVPAQESLSIIEQQLKAMTDISYDHDSWILDEGNSKLIKKMAKKYGVKYFSRKGIAKYNQKTFPFEARTKAGNVNAWLDYVKRRKYDFFVQLDIDHKPSPNYLDKTLGHFRDPNVAWVQSPSVYSNLSYWTARGSAEQEMGFNGPIQMGFYGINHLPLIVGSHAAYRTEAIKQIGGFQPTRAEDQLNTLVLASQGWKGVFIPEILASGNGPETLNAYLTQQYAWARSIVYVIKGYSWKYLRQLPFQQALQFIFLQSWYPISVLTFFILYFTPILAIIFNLHIINISIQQFLIRILPFIFMTVVVLWTIKPLMQPRKLKYSWRGILLHLVRWPIIFNGIVSAVTNRKKPYQVTPKGKFLNKIPTTKLYHPFLLLGLVSASTAIYASFFQKHSSFQGQVVFVLYDLMLMLGVCLVDINLRLKHNKFNLNLFLRYWLKPVGLVVIFMLVSGFALTSSIIMPLRNSLALQNANVADYYSASVRLNTVPIDSLDNQQLDAQIALPIYKINKSKPVPSIGIYSPYIKVYNKEPYINSIFMDWSQNWMLQRGLVESNRTGATPLVTIEPKSKKSGSQLLKDIALGQYDQRLLTIFNTIKLDPNTVYVRFAQEMDLPNSFKWGNQNPNLYIAAYRHVVNLARGDGLKNINWVWSPAGLPSARLYYPGNNYVNTIGTTMIYDRYWSGNYQPSFYQLQQDRAWLLSYGKPVWIAEFGVGRSNPSFQAKLVKSALAQYKADGYSAIVYLNIPEPNISGPNYTLPNVSILDNIFSYKITQHKLNKSVIKGEIVKRRTIHSTPKNFVIKVKLPSIFKNIKRPYILSVKNKNNNANTKHQKIKTRHINKSSNTEPNVNLKKVLWFIK